jgi:hypothetical protein
MVALAAAPAALINPRAMFHPLLAASLTPALATVVSSGLVEEPIRLVEEGGEIDIDCCDINSVVAALVVVVIVLGVVLVVVGAVVVEEEEEEV